MQSPYRRGFTLVELLVVIAIIGTLVALLLPAVQAARGSARNNTCKNNLKQLSLALANYDTTNSKLPGYVNALVNPNNRTIGRRGSWVVMIFPFMEEGPLWDQWSQRFDQSPNAPSIDGLILPEIKVGDWVRTAAGIVGTAAHIDGLSAYVNVAGGNVGYFEVALLDRLSKSSRLSGPPLPPSLNEPPARIRAREDGV
jgi:prepilin-type N-terminal cleavage/methylation domain-containing protein